MDYASRQNKQRVQGFRVWMGEWEASFIGWFVRICDSFTATVAIYIIWHAFARFKHSQVPRDTKWTPQLLAFAKDCRSSERHCKVTVKGVKGGAFTAASWLHTTANEQTHLTADFLQHGQPPMKHGFGNSVEVGIWSVVPQPRNPAKINNQTLLHHAAPKFVFYCFFVSTATNGFQDGWASRLASSLSELQYPVWEGLMARSGGFTIINPFSLSQ